MVRFGSDSDKICFVDTRTPTVGRMDGVPLSYERFTSMCLVVPDLLLEIGDFRLYTLLSKKTPNLILKVVNSDFLRLWKIMVKSYFVSDEQ